MIFFAVNRGCQLQQIALAIRAIHYAQYRGTEGPQRLSTCVTLQMEYEVVHHVFYVIACVFKSHSR